jgi:hypothetical protein
MGEIAEQTEKMPTDMTSTEAADVEGPSGAAIAGKAVAAPDGQAGPSGTFADREDVTLVDKIHEHHSDGDVMAHIHGLAPHEVVNSF